MFHLSNHIPRMFASNTSTSDHSQPIGLLDSGYGFQKKAYMATMNGIAATGASAEIE